MATLPPSEFATRPRRLLDQVRDAIRVRHYSYRTEQAYVGWIRRFVLFHGKRHPAEMGAEEWRLSSAVPPSTASCLTRTSPWRRCCFS
jgi:hypothetical protein